MAVFLSNYHRKRNIVKPAGVNMVVSLVKVAGVIMLAQATRGDL